MQSLEKIQVIYRQNRLKIEGDIEKVAMHKKKSYQQIEASDEALRAALDEGEGRFFLQEGLKCIGDIMDAIDEVAQTKRKKYEQQLDDLDYQYKQDVNKATQ